MKLKNFIYAVWRGVIDSLMGTVTIIHLDERNEYAKVMEMSRRQTAVSNSYTRAQLDEQKEAEPKKSDVSVRKQVLQCCMLNGVIFGLSLAVIEFVIGPTLRVILHVLLGETELFHFLWRWISFVSTWSLHTLWVMPLFLLCKFISSLYFKDISDEAFRKTSGRPTPIRGFGTTIADYIFSTILELLFLIQGCTVSYVPVVGSFACLIHTAMLYSVYAFEYKWYNQGWELHKRLMYIENNWPYFIAFGLPLALLTDAIPSVMWRGAVFSTLFPVILISTMDAKPVTKICPDFPLRLFALVIIFTNIMFNVITKGIWRPTSGQKKKR